jgi:D-serine deaminase-like pyridoxal phosphate-dependent protein
MASQTGLKTHVWVDINNGMNRTGIVPGQKAIRLYKTISDSPMLIAEGLHVYDGHIHDPDLSVRQQKCSEAFVPVLSMINELIKIGIEPVKIIAGGSPTFPVHARHAGVETSPGTIILWDYGSSSNYSDMKFQHAAVLLTRIISKPEKDLLCIDLGHKAVASEMPQPRVMIQGLINYRIIKHNEEHMVIRTTDAGNYKTGDLLYAIPWHICPTVDRYDTVTVVNDHRASGQWNVEARKRKITF